VQPASGGELEQRARHAGGDAGIERVQRLGGRNQLALGRPDAAIPLTLAGNAPPIVRDAG